MSKRRLCKYCRCDLELWGPNRRRLCPDCAGKLRSVKVKCAGRCGGIFEIRSLEKISFYFNPGNKGGRKISLYICTRCLSVMRSRAEDMDDKQSGEISMAEERLIRNSKGV